MATLEISVKSRAYVKVQISALVNGATVDPTANAVVMAFPPIGTDPTVWYTASWETSTTDPVSGSTTAPRYYTRCLVGAGGTIALPVGTYDVYAQITDLPEIAVVKSLDTLQVY